MQNKKPMVRKEVAQCFLVRHRLIRISKHNVITARESQKNSRLEKNEPMIVKPTDTIKIQLQRYIKVTILQLVISFYNFVLSFLVFPANNNNLYSKN